MTADRNESVASTSQAVRATNMFGVAMACQWRHGDVQEACRELARDGGVGATVRVELFQDRAENFGLLGADEWCIIVFALPPTGVSEVRENVM